MAGTIIDLVGQVFGKLTVAKLADDYVRGKARWVCQCECGGASVVIASNLTRGHTTSCGCHKKANLESGLVAMKHGATAGLMGKKNQYPRSYKTWCSMRQRCFDPNSEFYKDYGGRGITVCPEWDDYAQFVADMGEPPPGKSLDRIDNDGPYSAANCKWSTRVEQARNKRTTRHLTFQGKTATLPEWADELGIPRKILYQRVYRGWPVDRVFSKAVGNVDA